jgi:hypothetical protein
MSICKDKYRGTREYFLATCELIGAARARTVVNYKQIAQLTGLPQRGSYVASQMGQLLGEIAEDEVNRGRPMLSAVAVGVSGKPGSGFYALARLLGRLKDDSEAAEDAFWRSELEAVYATWAAPKAP